jgi:D-serine deaminase-like pyridoxal phosphate-dependent protein
MTPGEAMNAATGPAIDAILERITRPTLLLDEARVRRNIERMVQKTKRARVRLRPHAKTHQSAVIGEWFKQAGVSAITVSSVDMARYFADAGYDDITLAFPVNLRQLDEIGDLARHVDLGLLIDDPLALDEVTRRIESPVRVWIKVDAGYGRAGLAWDEPASIATLACALTERAPHRFAGLLAHAGQSYAADSRARILAIHDQTLERMAAVKQAVLAAGVATCPVSIGDTPCCSAADSFPGADEVRPGNFVFYDLVQERLGSCAANDIAVAVACPIVGVHPRRGRLVLYGGAIHLSKDSLTEADGRPVFGYLAQPDDRGWGNPDRSLPLISLSQEHGVVAADRAALDQLKVGDVAVVVPVHSCLTAEMFDSYLTLDGRTIDRG